MQESFQEKSLMRKILTPVEYANIVLFDTVTRSMVTGVVSDSNGLFRIKDIPPGNYYIEYSFIGYAKQRTKTIDHQQEKNKV